MKLEEIRIQNFRSYIDETITLDNYVAFVGTNGSGKSNILCALNVLFRDNSSSVVDLHELSEEDFFNRDVTKPIIITATFGNLTEEAKEELSHYVRHDKLTVTAEAKWDERAKRADVKQKGERFVIKSFVPFFEALASGEKSEELQLIYQTILKKFTDLPNVRTKPQMEKALRDYEEGHAELCELVASESQFYGWTKGGNLLGKFIKWIYIPAVKDASSEQDESKASALGQLLNFRIRSKVSFSEAIEKLKQELEDKYKVILDEQQGALTEISKSIEGKLKTWSHQDTNLKINWHYDREKNLKIESPFARALIGEKNFMGEIARLGHGMQRSFIIALLQELAQINTEKAPTLILGIEEPELYQHPPQARYFAELLTDLSKSNFQILFTTHSPYFVSAEKFENVRRVKRTSKNNSVVKSALYEDIAKVLGDALGEEPSKPTEIMAAVKQIILPVQSELFFSDIPIFVEGNEDIAFVTTYLSLTNNMEEFRRLGFHFIPCDGKTNLSRPLAVANALDIPSVIIFDADGETGKEKETKRNNDCLVNLKGYDSSKIDYSKDIFEKDMIIWKKDIFSAVSEGATFDWNKYEESARKNHALNSGVRRKNPILISATLESIFKDGHKVPILDNLCQILLRHGVSQRENEKKAA